MTMQVAIHATGSDVDAQIAYCHRLGVEHICLFARAMPGVAERGYPDEQQLRTIIRCFIDAGIKVPVMAIGRPTPAAILGKPEADQETEQMLKTIAVVGEAGVRAALIYHRAPVKQDDLTDTQHWQCIVRHWRALIDQAERSDVRLANHAYYVPGTMMVWNVETNLKLIEEIPSPYNGITYCTKLYMADDDVYSAIEKFRGRIFFAHTRDLVRVSDPDYWVRYDEVQLGDGDLDFPRVLNLLDQAGFEGVVAPEHLGEPRTLGEEPEEVAVSYLRRHLT